MSFLQLFQSCDENHQNFFFRTIKITFTINITTLPQRKKKHITCEQGLCHSGIIGGQLTPLMEVAKRSNYGGPWY